MSKEELKYNGKFVQVAEVELEGLIWEKVYMRDGVMVFPITKDGKIILIEERRPHEKKPTRLKFVTGQMDKGEDPIETANREMQEEIGFKSSNMQLVLHKESTGTINQHFYQVIAKDLVESKIPNPDGEDTIVSQKAYSVEEIFTLLDNQELEWSMAILGIMKMQREGLI